MFFDDASRAVLPRLPKSIAEKLYYRFLCGRKTEQDGKQVTVPVRSKFGNVKYDVIRGDVIGDSIYFTGVYEPKSTRELSRIAAQDGGLFVDVGANIGYYSVLWCKANAKNRCLSIEVSPRNLELLNRNITQNSITDNCTVAAIAASNSTGTVSFDQGPIAQTGWGGISDGVGSGTRVITVPSSPLDELVPPGEKIRLLKIDVEGAETLVLEGAFALLRDRRVQEVWFEDNEFRRGQLNIECDRLMKPLRDNGYTIHKSTRAKPLPMDFVATCS